MFTSDLKFKGIWLKWQKQKKLAFSSHLSHPEKTVTAKNEESNFQQVSVREGRLPWGSDGELKARKKAHISSVC